MYEATERARNKGPHADHDQPHTSPAECIEATADRLAAHLPGADGRYQLARVLLGGAALACQGVALLLTLAAPRSGLALLTACVATLAVLAILAGVILGLTLGECPEVGPWRRARNRYRARQRS